MKAINSFKSFAIVATSLLCLPSAAQAADPAKVRVAFINNIQSAVLLRLQSLGKEQNLAVELIPFTRYPDVQKALAVNSVDIGPIAPNGLPAAVAQGDRNVLAVLDLVYGGDALVIRSGVNANKLADLKGKRIGVAEGGIAWIMFVMLLERNGMSYGDVKTANFGGATDMVSALKRGDMDAVNLWEPFIAEAVAGGFGKTSPAFDFANTPLGGMNGILGASRAFATQHPDSLVTSIRLILRAEGDLEKNRQLWTQTVRGYSNLSDNVLKQALSGIRYAGPTLSLSKLNAAATFLYKAGIAKTDVTGKLGDTVNPRFLAKATGKSEAEVLK